MIERQTLELRSELARELPSGLLVKAGVPARNLTTFGLGGNVETFIEVQRVDVLQELLRSLKRRGVSWRILGAGSNVIFGDGGLDSPVIRLGRELGGYRFLDEEQSGRVAVSAAASLMTLSRELSAAGFSGLEFAAGIPASLGGAVKMNAGAHGHSISEVVTSATVLDASGELRTREASELAFGYRRSSIAPGEIVVSAELALNRAEPEKIKAARSACLEYRKKTQPLHMPSSGSVFRNPSLEELSQGKIAPGEAAAKLLERAGLKGMRRGAVGYAELHSNWLVRHEDEGRTADAHALIELGVETVEREFNVRLEPEIIIWS